MSSNKQSGLALNFLEALEQVVIVRQPVVELGKDIQETFLRAISSFMFLNDDMIGLDFSKTSSSSFSSMSSWEETLDLRSSISYSNPEANVSHADSQREAIGSFASAALAIRGCLVVLAVFSCTLQFLEGSESKSDPTEVR